MTQRELDRWIAFRGSVIEDRDLAIRELILLLTLSQEAERLELDRRPELRIELAMRDGQLARPYLQRYFQQKLGVSDEAAEAKYQAIKDTYTRPRRLRLRNLFKRYPADVDAETRAQIRRQMEELRQRVIDGEDFAELAAEESDSQTRLQGGLLGNVRAGTFPPAVDAVAMALEEGEVSEILSGSSGLTMLYCERVLEKVHRTPEELREIARNLLEKRALDEAWTALEQRLNEAAAITIDWPAIFDPNPEQARDTAELARFHNVSLNRAELRELVGSSKGALRDESRQAIEAAVERLAERRMWLVEVERLGLADGSLAEARRWTRHEILAGKALAYHVDLRLERPSEADLRAAFETERDRYERSEHFRLALIALPLDDDNRLASYDAGFLLLDQLSRGALSFEDAARRHSSLPSAAAGGLLPPISRWVVPGRYGIEFLRELKRLEVGERSGLVESNGRLYIFELRGRETPRPQTFDEARRAVENRLGNQRVERIKRNFTREWLADLQIESPRRTQDATLLPADAKPEDHSVSAVER